MGRRRLTSPSAASIYRARFVNRVHELLQRGISEAGLDDSNVRLEQEITGLLVGGIRAVIEKSTARWAWHFAVHDDAPINGEGRLGARRRRVDIAFERTQRGQHPRFELEAKRLRSRASIGKYLGASGLGCFLSGAYASDLEDGGMLGYVQNVDEATWASAIEQRMGANREAYKMRQDGGWVRNPMLHGPTYVFITRHNRSRGAKPIAVYHTLIRA